jgi:hypothetical protein
MNEGINLLLDPKKSSGPSALFRRLQKVRLFAVGLLFLVSVVSVILFILVTISPLPTLQKQEQFLRQSLTASKDDIAKLNIVEAQTDIIDQLVNKRQSIDKPISLVQSKMTSDMSVTEIQTDKATMSLTVESSSLQSLDTFLNALAAYVQSKNTFSNVTLVDLTTDESTNQYAVTVQLNYL